MSRRGREAGQASVELVAMLPLAVAVMLTVLQVLAAGAAQTMAGHAAGAGAVALLQQRDPDDAARAAVPDWSKARTTVTVRGSVVSVRLRPVTLVPGLAGRLVGVGEADAGRRP